MSVTDVEKDSGMRVQTRNGAGSRPSVTVAESVPGDSINSGNALSESEARSLTNTMKSMGVTGGDSPAGETIERRNAIQRTLAASHTAEACGKCERGIAAGETIYIACTRSGYNLMGNYTRWYAPVCVDCASPYMKGEGRFYHSTLDRCEKQPCDTCSRPVVWKATGRDYYRRHVFCCERCRWTYYNTVRDERNARAREKVCEACGESFTATRRDAKTCSASCKQKAYRRRKKGGAA